MAGTEELMAGTEELMAGTEGSDELMAGTEELMAGTEGSVELMAGVTEEACTGEVETLDCFWDTRTGAQLGAGDEEVSPNSSNT